MNQLLKGMVVVEKIRSIVSKCENVFLHGIKYNCALGVLMYEYIKITICVAFEFQLHTLYVFYIVLIFYLHSVCRL
jgi:hypothetical protein